MKRWHMIVNKRIRYVMREVNSARLNGLSEVYLSIDLEEKEKTLLKNSGYKIEQDESWVGAGEWESFTVSWSREHEEVINDVAQSKVCIPIERELAVRKENDEIDKNLSLAERIKKWETNYPVPEIKDNTDIFLDFASQVEHILEQEASELHKVDDEQDSKPTGRYGQRELTDIMFDEIFG